MNLATLASPAVPSQPAQSLPEPLQDQKQMPVHANVPVPRLSHHPISPPPPPAVQTVPGFYPPTPPQSSTPSVADSTATSTASSANVSRNGSVESVAASTTESNAAMSAPTTTKVGVQPQKNAENTPITTTKPSVGGANTTANTSTSSSTNSSAATSTATSTATSPAHPSPPADDASDGSLGGMLMRKVPCGAKMFRCTGFGNCNMSFSRSEHLARHIRKHTGERPFHCECGRAFSRLDNLRQHIYTVHANDPLSYRAIKQHQQAGLAKRRKSDATRRMSNDLHPIAPFHLQAAAAAAAASGHAQLVQLDRGHVNVNVTPPNVAAATVAAGGARPAAVPMVPYIIQGAPEQYPVYCVAPAGTPFVPQMPTMATPAMAAPAMATPTIAASSMSTPSMTTQPMTTQPMSTQQLTRPMAPMAPLTTPMAPQMPPRLAPQLQMAPQMPQNYSYPVQYAYPNVPPVMVPSQGYVPATPVSPASSIAPRTSLSVQTAPSATQTPASSVTPTPTSPCMPPPNKPSPGGTQTRSWLHSVLNSGDHAPQSESVC